MPISPCLAHNPENTQMFIGPGPAMVAAGGCPQDHYQRLYSLSMALSLRRPKLFVASLVACRNKIAPLLISLENRSRYKPIGPSVQNSRRQSSCSPLRAITCYTHPTPFPALTHPAFKLILRRFFSKLCSVDSRMFCTVRYRASVLRLYRGTPPPCFCQP